MANFSRTWWGKRFIEALESFSEDNRLGRGRSYARNGKVLNYEVNNGKITAKVRGSINPYFGVYKEPLYKVSIEIKPISAQQWSKAIKQMASKASVVSKLLLNEVPDNIEDCVDLLPHSRGNFKTNCSCPDYANPCKHIAGVYYLVASQLDADPLLLFELRGLSREKLQKELAKSPLGKALSSAITDDTKAKIVAASSYYTKPKEVSIAKPVDLNTFWNGTQAATNIDSTSTTTIPAILIKKAGDFPAFWKSDTSFIEVMEDFYKRVRARGLR